MAALLDDPLLDYELVRKKLNITCHGDTRVGRTACSRRRIREQVYRNPVHAENIQRRRLFIRRSRSVRLCVSVRIMKNEIENIFAPWVTGSGKTEVYMEMIQSVVDKGKQAIVLIPRSR